MGLTQTQVAAACGVTFQQIQKYESALSQLSIDMLCRLARVLEVSPAYFFDGVDGLTPTPAEPRSFREPAHPG